MCVPEILLPFLSINEALFVVRCYLIITRIMTYTQVIDTYYNKNDVLFLS